MKKNIAFFLSLVTLFIACKKNDTDKGEKSGPAILLSKVYYIASAKSIGFEFKYDGKRLIKATRYGNLDHTIWEEHNFIYDAQGKLSKINITRSAVYPTAYYDYSGATFTYDGNNIRQISFKYVNMDIRVNYTLSYQNNKLIRMYTEEGSTVVSTINYSYNSNGNQNIDNSTAFISQYISGPGNTNNIAFDNMNNLADALPFSIYFTLINRLSYVSTFPAWTPGTNNVLARDKKLATSDYIYSSTFQYQYNSYGYPSQIKVLGDPTYQNTYYYEYIKVD